MVARVFAVLSLFIAALTAAPALAEEPDYGKMSNAALIDALVRVNTSASGLGGIASWDLFMGEDGPARFQGGIILMSRGDGPFEATRPPRTPPEARELVRRGVAALPDLMRHLRDRRETGILVGRAMDWNKPRYPLPPGALEFTFAGFSANYDPRRRERGSRTSSPLMLMSSGGVREIEVAWGEDEDPSYRPSALTRDFPRGPRRDLANLPPMPESYYARIGDVCFVLVGQIVNRRLNVGEYVPTMGMRVNSPVIAPSLALETRRDWSGLTAAQHRASLLADIAAAPETGWGADDADSALARLRFYYPDAYAGLTGTDANKREHFKKREAEWARRG